MCVRYLRFSNILKLILLSLLINLIFCSLSLGVTWVDTTTYVDNLPLLDYLITQAGIDDSQANFASTSAYNNYMNFRDKVYTSVYYGGNFYKDNTAFREVRFVLSTTGNVTTTSSSGKLSANTIVGSITRQTNGSTNFTWSNNGEYSNSVGEMGYFGNSNWRWGAIYGNGVWRQTQSNDYNVDQIITPPSFTPLYDHIIGINGLSNDSVYNFNEYLGGVPDTTSFGSFTDNFDDFIVDIHLNKYWNLTQGSLIARSTFYNSYYGSGTLTFNDNKDLYINDRYLEYNTIYCLMIYVYKDYTEFSNGNPLAFNYYYYYITTPTSAIATGDTIDYSGNSNYIAPSVDNNINNTNDNSQVTTIMGNFLSGDVASKMGYDTSIFENDQNGQYWNFLWGFWQNCYDTLISSQNVAMTFTIHGRTYTYYSSDYITPNSLLKNFVSTFLVVGFFFLMYQQIVQFIHELEEGDLMVMHDTDADIYFFDL